MFVILAACGLGFAAWLAFGSRLYFERVQIEAYQTLRVPLANGTAPISPSRPYNPKKLLAVGSPVAIVQIPALHIQDVVLKGTTGAVLEGGPGHQRDTPMPGQVGISVILGRRPPTAGRSAGWPAWPRVTTSRSSPGRPWPATGWSTCAGRDPRCRSARVRAGRMVLVTADGAPLVPTGMLYVDADLISKPSRPRRVLTSATCRRARTRSAPIRRPGCRSRSGGSCCVIVAAALAWLWNAWGRWQTWLVAVPVVGFIVLSVADQVTRLLPNLM